MASTTDPRAAAFDAAAVRSGLEFAMNMGLPDTSSERVKFLFYADKSYAEADATGNPYDFTSSPVTVTGTDREVEIPVALEFVARTSQARDTSMGFLLPSRVEVFILDTYIDEVRGADAMQVDGNLYEIIAWLPPVGLFDFTLYSATAEAVDES